MAERLLPRDLRGNHSTGWSPAERSALGPARRTRTDCARCATNVSWPVSRSSLGNGVSGLRRRGTGPLKLWSASANAPRGASSTAAAGTRFPERRRPTNSLALFRVSAPNTVRAGATWYDIRNQNCFHPYRAPFDVREAATQQKTGDRKRRWCPGAELNHRHTDFQSVALPTELPGRLARGAYRGDPVCLSSRALPRLVFSNWNR